MGALFAASRHRAAVAASFSMVIASDIGDKSFWMTAYVPATAATLARELSALSSCSPIHRLLATRLGPAPAFVGACLGLMGMTLLSALFGAVLATHAPAAFSSERITRFASAAILFLFGAQVLWPILRGAAGQGADDAKGDAATALLRTPPRAAFAAAALSAATAIAVAEWGDRSMLAIIALAATHGPLPVLIGGMAGHVLSSILAVVGGAALAARLPERTLQLVAGCQFILLAVATLVGY